MGIKDTPREEIPWFPAISYDKCSGCGNCVDFCSHGIFEWGENSKPIVANPYNCVVGCSGCRPICSVEAIEFPPLTILKQFQN